MNVIFTEETVEAFRQRFPQLSALDVQRILNLSILRSEYVDPEIRDRYPFRQRLVYAEVPAFVSDSYYRSHGVEFSDQELLKPGPGGIIFFYDTKYEIDETASGVIVLQLKEEGS